MHPEATRPGNGPFDSRKGVLQMTTRNLSKSSPVRRLAVAGLAAGVLLAIAASAPAGDGRTLGARHGVLRGQLARNPFRRPLVVESTRTADGMTGEVWAVIAQPWKIVEPTLGGIAPWCDLLILHPNVKHCASGGQPPNERLRLSLGRKVDQAVDDTFAVDFAFRTVSRGAGYFQVELTAEKGPFRTKDYRIAIEAIPLDGKSTFLHLSYSYAGGLGARMAMRGYLATAGRNKVGFSILGESAAGEPIYVDGIRGVVERNAMRYFLAIEAYLGAVSSPPADRLEKRLRDGYAAAEKFPLQLHEMERDEYLAMKRRETTRQQATAARAKER